MASGVIEEEDVKDTDHDIIFWSARSPFVKERVMKRDDNLWFVYVDADTKLEFIRRSSARGICRAAFFAPYPGHGRKAAFTPVSTPRVLCFVVVLYAATFGSSTSLIR
jgi:hypothetical protein